MRLSLCVLTTFVAVFILSSNATAQTEGTCTFSVRTMRTYDDYDPKHVLAIWVTDSSNHFVKTLKRRAGDRVRYLYTWTDVSDENAVDAVTGATLNSHETHNVTWNCRDTSGDVVPDGVYRIRVEFSTEHDQGPLTPRDHIEFTKGPDQVGISPSDISHRDIWPDDNGHSDLTYFTEMSLTYAPDVETHVLVAAESEWKYNDTGTDLHDSDWKLFSYDDSSWDSGPAKLGYSDDPATTLSYGGDPDDKYPCYYFRHKFNINYLPESLKVFVLRDDGAVVYLNGSVLARENMDSGPTAYSDLANDTVGGSDEDTFHLTIADESLLIIGDNILSVEVHQGDVDSSDLGFDLELKASPPTGTPTGFKRGDTNNDDTINIADVVAILDYLFSGGDQPDCLSTSDTNDDDGIDISDAVTTLTYLFGSLDGLPAPFPDCGEDPTEDELSCDNYSHCAE